MPCGQKCTQLWWLWTLKCPRGVHLDPGLSTFENCLAWGTKKWVFFTRNYAVYEKVTSKKKKQGGVIHTFFFLLLLFFFFFFFFFCFFDFYLCKFVEFAGNFTFYSLSRERLEILHVWRERQGKIVSRRGDFLSMRKSWQPCGPRICVSC